ncbi:rubrerythrin family protein [Thermoanaerobacterium thermosaccharolyticum]|uniref:rubrerythrin family protein n=1 Tax=Thermoanaerobacterium thermosaccharolyticum TaxID=1517 RepID=UPI0017840C98|nr:rubrerythrin family protein [Thermoanaerobacterium thermosaccharolyticum]MBE0069649.1 rubrerythrin family protein [Thermoanaerobacterium thermosaccharolyticum]MBE0229348.1 rubrerythrin family protein [Thermoanaerobacterium thermosaccharolyticum]
MREMTKKNLSDAYAGESQAHMRYQIFADVAEKEGKPNIAKLFRAISYAELVHARNHYNTLGEVKDTVANLDKAIAGETFEVEEMYPAYKAVADLQEEKAADRSFNYALEAEKIHAKMYTDAKAAALKNEDIKISKVYICPVCGYTVIDTAPEKCPVCGAPRDKFVVF